MSGVNVLSVMDRLIGNTRTMTGLTGDPRMREHLREGEEARAAVAELIEADWEYEAARRDWDHVTAHDPEETSDETWRLVADRFEVAVMRRATALARVGAP